MGMSTRIEGFKPPDEKFKKMAAVYEACRKANVEVPDEVRDFFNGEAPDKAGVCISQKALLDSGAIKTYSADMQDGFEVDIRKLPPDVTIIRFVNSY